MAFTVLMMNERDAERLGLALPANLADKCGKRVVGTDETGKEFGIWWYAKVTPEGEDNRSADRQVLYSGTYDADNPIGSPATTQAQVYDFKDDEDRAEYVRDLGDFTDSPLAAGGSGPVLLELKDEGIEGASERDFDVKEEDTGEVIEPFDLGSKRPLRDDDLETP